MTIWTPQLDRYPGPRYKALADAIAEAISSGELSPKTKLPTHRALADTLGVTVGTVTRGYAEAERRDLVTARVGSGTYVRSASDPTDFSFVDENSSGTIDLSLSLPIPCHRDRLVKEGLENVCKNKEILSELLSYTPEAGLLRHRRTGSQWLQLSGIKASPEQIVVCNGGQHGLSLSLQVLTHPGDVVFSEGLCFPGLLGATRQLHLRHVGIPFDNRGIIPQQLEAFCQQYSPRVLYCTPNMHNPTTVCTPQKRRQEIVEICRRHDVSIIEDDVQPTTPQEDLLAYVDLAPERTFHIDSCSKALAGGLRIGFLLCPIDRVTAVTKALRASVLTTPSLMAELVKCWLEEGQALALSNWQREEIETRSNIAKTILKGQSFQYQNTGFNLWLSLPEKWRASQFVQCCAEQGVKILSAESFAVGRFPSPQAVRISLSSPATQDQYEKDWKEYALYWTKPLR